MTILLGFWVGGYFLGSLAWLLRGPVLAFVQNLGMSSEAAGALLAGLIGSSVMVMAIMAWSFLSSSN